MRNFTAYNSLLYPLVICWLLMEDDNQGCFFTFVNTVQRIHEKALPFCRLPEFQRFRYSVLPSHKPVCDYFWLTKKGNPTLQPVRSSCNLYWPASCGCCVSPPKSILLSRACWSICSDRPNAPVSRSTDMTCRPAWLVRSTFMTFTLSGHPGPVSLVDRPCWQLPWGPREKRGC